MLFLVVGEENFEFEIDAQPTISEMREVLSAHLPNQPGWWAALVESDGGDGGGCTVWSDWIDAVKPE